MFRTFMILALLAGFSAPVAAQQGQFYFLAKRSIDPATSDIRVELRWDVTEGELPADVVAFRLLRNGTAVAPTDWPARSVMSPARIESLYQRPGQARQRLETMTRLNELASDAGDTFSASRFAQTLHALIDPASSEFNPLWSLLGSRTDYNLALARYRGFVDTNPGTGTVEYELLGVDASGQNTVRLGLVDVDLGLSQDVLAATEFRQVLASERRCDMPESAKDQYTVMLDWLSPGVGNEADRVAAQSAIAGFDVYRSTDNLAPGDPAPARDIAALVSGAAFDERGRPLIDGLEKVNSSLIIDPGVTTYAEDWVLARQRLVELGIDVPEVSPQNRPVEPKWMEARDNLLRAGLRPGDRRAYYLVPRIFNGEYGPTAATVVTVPELTRPPAPWDLRDFPDESSAVVFGGPETLNFTWDEINVDAYVDAYRGTRSFCNLVEARSTGILEYVPAGRSCDDSVRNRVRLDVSRYRVYRFTDFDVAGRFKDSDGDGYEDAAEVPDLDGDGRRDAFERSLGTQCNVDATPSNPNAVSYLVYARTLAGEVSDGVELALDSDLAPDAPGLARMRDQVPASSKDTVYWYRVAAEAGPRNSPTVGRLSFLSAPQRGFFPDREPPAPPVVTVTKDGEKEGRIPVEPGELVPGGPQVTVEPPPAGRNGAACVALYENFEGSFTRVAQTCDPLGITYSPRLGTFCGFAVAMDENNNLSAVRHFPCTITPAPAKAPSPPLIQTFAVDDSQARFSFRLPNEAIAVAMARLDYDPQTGSNERTLESIPVIDNEGGEVLSVTLPVDALAGNRDRFCLSMLSIAQEGSDGTALSSDWSTKRCVTRTAFEETPAQYLPWPEVQGPPEDVPLTGAYVSDYRNVAPFLAMPVIDASGLLQDSLATESECVVEGEAAPVEQRQTFDTITCPSVAVARFRRQLLPELNFILYRQSRKAGGTPSDWIQVSPLIDYVHFDREVVPLGDRELTLWTLNDPFIKVIPLNRGDTLRVIYQDRYPFLANDLVNDALYEWRYQAVYFDEDHRPLKWRISEWFRDDVQ